MNPRYYNTVDQIYHAHWSIGKLSRLELLRRSVAALWPEGHPTRLIHVAGTSGKGSTCRFLELGFSLVGKTGALMGPHLFDYRERFSIGGVAPEQDAITELWETTIKPFCLRLALDHSDHTLSFHEVTILMALALFEKYGVAWAAIETGVGGCYDQTTALDVVASVLTNVGRDHEHLLGSEPWQRTIDKTGIARSHVPFFTSEQDPDNLAIITTMCAAQHAPLFVTGADDAAYVQHLTDTHASNPPTPDPLLQSAHQHWNAALSRAVVRHLAPQVEDSHLIATFLTASLPGRFWCVEPGIYADIAHNPDKTHVLAQQLTRQFADGGLVVVAGVTGERSAVEVLRPLTALAKVLIITAAPHRGQEPQTIAEQMTAAFPTLPVLSVSDPLQALQIAKAMRQPSDSIILTGSTYMIDQALNPDPFLRHLNATYGWRSRPR